MRKLGFGLAAYVFVVGVLTAYRWHVWMYGSDTGTFAQTILNAFSGFENGPEHGSHFRYHFSPLLAALFPLLAVTHSGLALQLAQVVLVALASPLLFALIRPYVSTALALRIAALVLVYPPLLAIAFEEFHEVAFYPALAVGLLWAADQGRWRWFCALVILAVLVREDLDLQLSVIGAGLAVLALRTIVPAAGCTGRLTSHTPTRAARR